MYKTYTLMYKIVYFKDLIIMTNRNIEEIFQDMEDKIISILNNLNEIKN